MRVLRLARPARVLKIARYSESLQTLARVLRAKRSELSVSAMAGGLLLICASSLMYFAENEAQPEQFSSIPAAMWWGVETKLMGSVIAVLGIGMFALPAGILASGFSDELRRKGTRNCPHCGAAIE